MRLRTLLPLLLAFACAAAPASAQQLSLTIRDGLVNLDTSGATVKQILDAWSRIGGTRIVNGERVTGGPVTLKLVDVPERQALEVILRSAAGYMAAPRAANAAPGASMFDRIMVLPTSSSAPASTAAKAAPPTPQNPFFRGRPNMPEDTDEQPADSAADAGQQPPVFSFPNQNPPEPGSDSATPFGQPAGANPFGQAVPNGGSNAFGQAAPPSGGSNAFGQPGMTNPQPAQQPATPFGTPQQQPAQANPFGQVQPTTPFGQAQTPVMNPFAAAAAAAQQQQQQQQQQMPAPAPGSFTIIGSPTPGVVTPAPAPRPPGQQQQR